MQPRFGWFVLLVLAACGKAPAPGNVDIARLQAAQDEPGQWLALGRTWHADRFSPLTKISVENAGTLGFAWEYEFRSRRGRVEHGQEATPLVVDGVIYASGPWGSAIAVDAKTGKERWRYDPVVDGSYNRKACCDVVSRGLQVWQGRVYVATLDGHLVALDARDGKEVWKVDTLIDRNERSYSITGPPQVAGSVVVIGNSGAEFGVRGYVTAYDLESGAQRWRFYSVPGDPAKGPPEHPEMATALATWSPNADWASGLGGTVWGEMNYDPELDLLYVGTGNASPLAPWVRSPGGGDNLFLASILAIKPGTGKLAWYFQTTPGEMWDYTATQNMILADLTIDGRLRKVLMQAPKNGYFYVLDRATGEFISARPYVFTNWTTGLDAKGRPTINPVATYEKKPALIFPTGAGGHNWPPMAFNPHTGLVYIPALEASAVFWIPPTPFVYEKGAMNTGGLYAFPAKNAGDWGLEGQAAQHLPPLSQLGAGQPDTTVRAYLRAWDPIAKRVAWQVETSGDWVGQMSALANGGGVMSSAGGLVFQGRSTGYLHVYRATDGEQLLALNVGTSIMAAPMTYELDGVQYVAVGAGFGGALGGVQPPGTAAARYGNAARIVAFRLGGGAVPLPAEREAKAPFPRPAVDRFGIAAQIDHGNELLKRHCTRCHVNSAGGTVPDLRRASAETHARFEAIVLDGARAASGMGAFRGLISTADAQDIRTAIVDSAWRAYEASQGAPDSAPHKPD